MAVKIFVWHWSKCSVLLY